MIASGRWNQVNTPVVYAADHPATAMLETLAHLNIERVPRSYRLLGIDVPDDAPSYRMSGPDLPPNWQSDVARTQVLGTRLLDATEHLMIIVPTVLVPFAWNALLNPRHPGIDRCRIVEVFNGTFDLRLIR